MLSVQQFEFSPDPPHLQEKIFENLLQATKPLNNGYSSFCFRTFLLFPTSLSPITPINQTHHQMATHRHSPRLQLN